MNYFFTLVLLLSALQPPSKTVKYSIVACNNSGIELNFKEKVAWLTDGELAYAVRALPAVGGAKYDATTVTVELNSKAKAVPSASQFFEIVQKALADYLATKGIAIAQTGSSSCQQ